MPKFKFMDFKKRFCRYLLNHYLGQYLEEKFTLDQLSVDLYNGKGCITDVSLDCRVSRFFGSICAEVVGSFEDINLRWNVFLGTQSNGRGAEYSCGVFGSSNGNCFYCCALDEYYE